MAHCKCSVNISGIIIIIIITVIVIMAEQEASNTTKQRCALRNLHVLRKNPRGFFFFFISYIVQWAVRIICLMRQTSVLWEI